MRAFFFNTSLIFIVAQLGRGGCRDGGGRVVVGGTTMFSMMTYIITMACHCVIIITSSCNHHSCILHNTICTMM